MLFRSAHTGTGIGIVWTSQTPANCTNGTPSGISVNLVIRAVRLPPGGKAAAPARDSDGDGCPDKKELTDTQSTGGLRDPSNRWDFFNPAKGAPIGSQTVADIIKTVQAFNKPQGNAAYTIDNDRTGLVGGNAWNYGPPDGQQTVVDILAAVKQFNQNCTP